MITAKERLLQFLEYVKMGQNAFEKKVKIANGYISHNKGSIGSSVIGKIAIAYPELNTSWLLTGEGEMLKSGLEKEPQAAKPSMPSEADFNKIADACQTLATSNAKLVEQLTESLARIEKKIDNREGALPESGNVLRTGRE